MARTFQELLDKMPTDARERAVAKTKELIEDYALDQLREARSLTQAPLAEISGKDQPAISRRERSTDIVRPMGGSA